MRSTRLPNKPGGGGFYGSAGIKKAIVVGASWRSSGRRDHRLDYPERVHKLVLIGAVTNDDAKKAFCCACHVCLIGDVATPLFLGSRWILKQRMQAMSPDGNQSTKKWWRRVITCWRPRTLIGRCSDRRAWSANRIEREASLIRQPTMIVWGDQDDHFPIANAFRLRDAIPNSKLIVFRNCGHLPPAEYPENFVEAVADFCGT